MEDNRLIDCGGMVVGGGGGEHFVTFNPRRPFNFYWNDNCIILPKFVGSQLVIIMLSAMLSGATTLSYHHHLE